MDQVYGSELSERSCSRRIHKLSPSVSNPISASPPKKSTTADVNVGDIGTNTNKSMLHLRCIDYGSPISTVENSVMDAWL